MRLWSVGRWLRGRHYRREPRRQWILHILDKLSLLRGPDVAREIIIDLWPACNSDEAHYATALDGIGGLGEIWSGQVVTADVHESAILWYFRLLNTNNRTTKKATRPFWADPVRYERRNRSDIGLFVLYHNLEVESRSSSALNGR